MKTRFYLLLTALLCLGVQDSFSQKVDSNATGFHNEFAIEITGLIDRFFSGESVPGSSRYELTYRRLFDRGNIRALLGVQVQQEVVEFESVPDESFNVTDQNIVTRVGYEWKSDIGERWQVFYGVDGVYEMSQTQTIFNISGLVVLRQNGRYTGVGISPFLGVRYYLNERISLYTDVAYTAMQQQVRFNEEIAWESSEASEEWTLSPEEKQTFRFIGFSAPLFLRLAVTL